MRILKQFNAANSLLMLCHRKKDTRSSALPLTLAKKKTLMPSEKRLCRLVPARSTLKIFAERYGTQMITRKRLFIMALLLTAYVIVH
jgi:hypothetical protein